MGTYRMIMEAAEILGWASLEAHDEGLPQTEKEVEEAYRLLIQIANRAREEAGQ